MFAHPWSPSTGSHCSPPCQAAASWMVFSGPHSMPLGPARPLPPLMYMCTDTHRMTPSCCLPAALLWPFPSMRPSVSPNEGSEVGTSVHKSPEEVPLDFLCRGLCDVTLWSHSDTSPLSGLMPRGPY